MADAPREGWSEDHDERARAAGFASWEHWCASIEAEKGHKVCGRRAKSSGAPCRKPAGAPSRRGKDTGHGGWGACGDHGGLSPVGPESGAYVHGERMDPKYRLRGNLADTYERVQAHAEDAFDLTTEANLLQTRMVQLLESLPEETVAPRTLRRKLGQVRAAIQEALKGNDPRALVRELRELEAAVDSARLEIQVWDEWRRLAEQKRKMADTKARQDARQWAPVTWLDLHLVAERFRQGLFRFVPEELHGDAHRYFRGLLETPGTPAELPEADGTLN